MAVLAGITRSDMRVLQAALSYARAFDVDLTVAILETEEGPSIEQLEDDVRSYLSEVDPATTVSVRSLPGHAGSQLVDCAEHTTVEQLFIDGGRKSPLGKIRITDAAEFALRNATTTVTLVR